MSAFNRLKENISVSAGGMPDLDESTTYFHNYGFRYEFRMGTMDPTTVIIITIYTIDRTNN